ncbi:hypothetical protein I3842_12G016500 [Carya illinoinensis]|uniref:Uncharacterized protein n=1 Tax=Carya illinoinensis TaxID=32201 RepID=A0A922IUH0_CARIL|nr:hypothetical protein I3842_12G016500 [Carya illinoinensis]
MAVTKALRKHFNAFHHGLHKKYFSYGSHEEALASKSILVDPIVWAKLCDRWGSDSFKCSKGVNLVEFYKDVSWSKKRNQFVTPETENIHM